MRSPKRLRWSSISESRWPSSSFAISSNTLGGLREAFGKPVGIGPVDAPVVFLRGNRQGQDLLLGERFEGTAAEAENSGKA
jgi:hypothetical protein